MQLLVLLNFGTVLPCWKADRCVLEHGGSSNSILEGLLPVQGVSVIYEKPVTFLRNTLEIAYSLIRYFFLISKYFATIKKKYVLFSLNVCSLLSLSFAYQCHCHSQILSCGFMG